MNSRYDSAKLGARGIADDGACVRLSDGRCVGLGLWGTDNGYPVFGLHGTPGSRLKLRAAHEAALATGIRLIAPDRWGYGDTDAPARPSLSEYGSDLGEIADRLGISRFGILAISGGGPFGAMAPMRLGARVTAVAMIGPVGPIAGFPMAGISAFHRISFLVLPRVPGGCRLAFGAFRAAVRHAPGLALAASLARAPAADSEIMASETHRTALLETFTAGLHRSALGPTIDMGLFARSWRPAQLEVGKARVWIGLQDGNVPVPAARRLAAMMGAELTEVPRAGHYWIAQGWYEVLQWLASSA